MLAILIPLLSLQAWYLYEQYRGRQASELRGNSEVARAVAGTLKVFIDDVLHQELAIGLHLTMFPGGLSVEQMNRVLRANKEAFPFVRNFAWVSPRGRIIASSLAKAIGVNVADRQYALQITKGSKWYVSNLLQARTTGEPVFAICRGIRDEKGKLLGIATAVVEAGELSTILRLELSQRGMICILDRKAMLVDCSPKRDLKWKDRNVLSKRPVIRQVMEGKEVAGIFPGFLNEGRRIVVCAPSGIGWTACISRSEYEAMAPIRYKTLQGLIFSLLLTTGILVTAFLLSHIITDPLRRLRQHALDLGSGVRTQPIPLKGPVEFLDLASSFNTMGEKIVNREEELRKSEEKYRELVENANCIIVRMDLNGTLVFLNEFGQRAFGYTEKEVLGRHVVGTIMPETDSAGGDLNSIIADIMRNPEKHAIHENENVGKDGTRLWVLWANRALFDQEGKVCGVLSVGTDITARKSAEESLRKSEAEKAGILGSLRNVAVEYLDAEMRVIWAKSETEQVLGLTPEKLQGGKCYEAIHGFSTPCRGCPVAGTLQTGKPEECEMTTEDGKVLLVSSNPVRDASGKVTSVVNASMDITARKRMEEALRGEISERKQIETMLRLDEARLEALWQLSQMSESSTDQIAEFALEQLVRLTGSQVGWIGFLDEAGAVSTFHVWPPKDLQHPGGSGPARQIFPGGADIFGDAIRERKVVVINDYKEFHAADSPEGHVGLARIMVVPVFENDRGVAIAGVGNKATEYDFSDARELTLLLDGTWKIIQREKAERHLRESESLAAMGRALAAVAHDMKTPLIAIGGFSRLAQKRIKDDASVHDLLEIVVQETGRMERMVKDMLDFSRPLELELSKTDIGRLVAECLTVVEPLAGEKKITLTNGIAPVTLLTASVDYMRIKQALINILTNAIQASQEGEEVIIGCDASRKNLAINVIDFGCGIPPDKKEEIFSPFYTSKKDGTGLGLPIVKKIIEAHRGRIEITDNPEKGTTFRVNIPL